MSALIRIAAASKDAVVVFSTADNGTVNNGDTLAQYKAEREQRIHEERIRRMRRLGFASSTGVCR